MKKNQKMFKKYKKSFLIKRLKNYDDFMKFSIVLNLKKEDFVDEKTWLRYKNQVEYLFNTNNKIILEEDEENNI